MSDSSPTVCPTCGAPLEEGACPRCLMAAAMMPTAHSCNDVRQPAPSVDAVAAAFPQLEILELIGQGGMGCVFKARQPKLNRLVALKLLPASLAERDAAFAGRFEREGQLLARLHHPNIVAVHDSGTAGEFFYIVMEFVNGVNLRQAMRARRFTPAQALSIVPHICDALQYAHDEGVLHRDIKPENILLDAKGRVKLADFGIAKLLADSETLAATHGPADATLTQSGATLGTPSYMAPEQRDSPNDVDHRADIYSLGVVFYELLTGELPRESLTPPSTKSEADPRVDAIVQQALEKERSRRQHSAGEVKTQVETLMQTPSPPAIVPASGDLFLGLLSLAAVVSTAVGTWISWKSFGTASETFIGLGEPWLVEGVYRYETGVQHATNLINSAWCVSSVAMMLATVFWVTWFWLKRAKGQPLDSFLRRGGNDHMIRVGCTCLAATAGSLWAFFFATGLYLAFSRKVLRNINPEVPVTAIYILALVLGFGWTLSRIINFGSSPASRAQTQGADLERAKSIPDPPTSLLPTIILHAVLFALVTVFFATAVPRFAAIYRDMGLALSPVTRSLIEMASNRGMLLLLLLMLLLDTGCCYLARYLGGRRVLRFCSSIVVVALVLIIAISGTAMFLPMQGVFTEFNSRVTPLPGRENSRSTGVESWSYTPRYLTGAKFAEWQKTGKGERAELSQGISLKDESGVLTLTGPPERVRRLATMLRIVDQPEVKTWIDLPILNMPPEFFLRTSLPVLMLRPDTDKNLLTAALRDSLEREGVTASQLARALSAHVFELEKATFVNTGPPFESITRSPGASTFYDVTIPCSDQPDKSLTLRIERTTQQMGTLSKFASFAPWLIEEAKKQSKEPLDAAAKVEAKDEAANQESKTDLEANAPAQL